MNLKKPQILPAIGLILALTASASEAAYSFRLYLPGVRSAGEPSAPSFSFALGGLVLPEAIVGNSYTPFSFQSALTMSGSGQPSLSEVMWQSSALPLGLSMSTTGDLSGIPLQAHPTGTSFNVQASSGSVSATETYSIRIIDPVVSLAAGAIPAAEVNSPYSFDLKTRTSVSGDPGYSSPSQVSYSLKAGNTLPTGLTLASSGVLSGTPSVATPSASFEVVGTYKTRSGEQAYTLVVNGEVLRVTSIAAGPGDSTCAITVNGAAKCWGNGALGRLGNGATANSLTPVQVVGLTSGVTAIEVGGSHACAIHNGAAKCWGSGSLGELGNSSTSASSVPVQVIGLSSGVSDISAGNSSTCAVQSGAAKCWGSNTSGRLGIGSTTHQSAPSQVIGLSTGVSSISAGADFACAVHNGAAKCWGEGSGFALGEGASSQSDRYSPVQVFGLTSGVSSISAGFDHGCAIHNDAAKCWGTSLNGRLGNGSTSDSNAGAPVQVIGLTSGVSSIVAGASHSCAIHNGAAKCWGNSTSSGRLGNSSISSSSTPVQVTGLSSGVTSLEDTYGHTCVLHNGTAKCWGDNGSGQLGDLTTTNKNSPVSVSGQ